MLPWHSGSARAQIPTQTTGKIPEQTPAVDAQQQRTPPPERRIPQQLTAKTGALQGLLLDEDGRSLAGVRVELVPAASVPSAVAAWSSAQSAGDGVFRLLHVAPGTYDLLFTPPGGVTVRQGGVLINPGEVLSIEKHLNTARATLPTPLGQMPAELLGDGTYRELSRRPDSEGAIVPAKELVIPAEPLLYDTVTDRWDIEVPGPPTVGAASPGYHRYPGMEAPYVLGHWYDPFNRNVLKGDKPLFGKTFFSFTGDSMSRPSMGAECLSPPANPGVQPGEYGLLWPGRPILHLPRLFARPSNIFHGDTIAIPPGGLAFPCDARSPQSELHTRFARTAGHQPQPHWTEPRHFDDHARACRRPSAK